MLTTDPHLQEIRAEVASGWSPLFYDQGQGRRCLVGHMMKVCIGGDPVPPDIALLNNDFTAVTNRLYDTLGGSPKLMPIHRVFALIDFNDMVRGEYAESNVHVLSLIDCALHRQRFTGYRLKHAGI